MPRTTATRVTPFAALDLSSAPRFATRDQVALALSLVPHESLPDAVVSIGTQALGGAATGARLGLDPAGDVLRERVTLEGPRCFLEVAPGVLRVRRTDPARRQRAEQRSIEDRMSSVDLRVSLDRLDDDQAPAKRGITSWSTKSRAGMIRRLATLDYAAALDEAPEGWALGMITLTYPGDWLTVAPGPDACRAHLAKFRRRFERRWGPLRAVWKREFQRRGAPHYHFGGLIPTDPEFALWLATEWTDIVGHPDAQERANMVAVHAHAIDYAKGAAATDPRRFASYFAKHGVFGSKEYQNEAPAEWSDEESIGRFWGYWRLAPLVLSAEVAPDVAQTIVRTGRRWVESRGLRTTVLRWRKVTTVDRETGEVGWKWRRRRTTVPVRRFQRQSGFLIHSDAPGLLEALSRAATAATTVRVVPPGRRSGLGPVGFLP